MIESIEVVLSLVVIVSVVARLFMAPTIVFAFSILGIPFVETVCNEILGTDSGVTIGLLLVSAMGFVMVARRYRIRLWENSLDEWLMLAYLCILVASLVYTSAPIYGQNKTLLFTGNCFPIFYLGRVCGRNGIGARRAIESGGLLSASVVAFLLLQWTHYDSSVAESGRFGGGVSILIGVWLVLCIGFQIPHVWHGRIWRRTGAIAVVVAAVVLIPLTGSRGSLLSLFVAFVIAFSTLRTAIKTACVLSGIAIVVFLALYFLAPTEVKERFRGASYADRARAQLFSLATEGLLANPVIGVGVGGFASLNPHPDNGDVDWRTYPHNLWLEVGCEQGVIGLAPILVLSGLGAVRLMRMRKQSHGSFSKTIQFLCVAAVLQVTFTGDLPFARAFFALMGLLAGMSYSGIPKNRAKPVKTVLSPRVG